MSPSLTRYPHTMRVWVKGREFTIPALLASMVTEGANLAPSVNLTQSYPESTEGRPWGQPLKKLEGAPVNLG